MVKEVASVAGSENPSLNDEYFSENLQTDKNNQQYSSRCTNVNIPNTDENQTSIFSSPSDNDSSMQPDVSPAAQNMPGYTGAQYTAVNRSVQLIRQMADFNSKHEQARLEEYVNSGIVTGKGLMASFNEMLSLGLPSLFTYGFAQKFAYILSAMWLGDARRGLIVPPADPARPFHTDVPHQAALETSAVAMGAGMAGVANLLTQLLVMPVVWSILPNVYYKPVKAETALPLPQRHEYTSDQDFARDVMKIEKARREFVELQSKYNIDTLAMRDSLFYASCAGLTAGLNGVVGDNKKLATASFYLTQDAVSFGGGLAAGFNNAYEKSHAVFLNPVTNKKVPLFIPAARVDVDWGGGLMERLFKYMPQKLVKNLKLPWDAVNDGNKGLGTFRVIWNQVRDRTQAAYWSTMPGPFCNAAANAIVNISPSNPGLAASVRATAAVAATVWSVVTWFYALPKFTKGQKRPAPLTPKEAQKMFEDVGCMVRVLKKMIAEQPSQSQGPEDSLEARRDRAAGMITAMAATVQGLKTLEEQFNHSPVSSKLRQQLKQLTREATSALEQANDQAQALLPPAPSQPSQESHAVGSHAAEDLALTV